MLRISPDPLQPARLAAELKSVRAGALATFEGWVRDHHEGRDVIALEYEAYEALCVSEGQAILDETQGRFDILAALCVHRVGRLEPGDLAVWVAATAVHRQDAFKACAHIIDQVKKRVPVWKKEYYRCGDSGWVNIDHATAAPVHRQQPSP